MKSLNNKSLNLINYYQKINKIRFSKWFFYTRSFMLPVCINKFFLLKLTIICIIDLMLTPYL